MKALQTGNSERKHKFEKSRAECNFLLAACIITQHTYGSADSLARRNKSQNPGVMISWREKIIHVRKIT
jgi:hypothetical protein